VAEQTIDFAGVRTVSIDGQDLSKLVVDDVRVWERYEEIESYQAWVTSGYTTNVPAGASKLSRPSYMYRADGYAYWNGNRVSSSQYEKVGQRYEYWITGNGDNGSSQHQYGYYAIRRKAYSYYTDTSHYETRYRTVVKYYPS
jgi:hypothetical protein